MGAFPPWAGGRRGLRANAPTTTVCAMSLPVARLGKPLLCTAALVGVLAACSLGGGTPHSAPATSKAPSSSAASAPATHDPLSGPIEPASSLPKTCAAILSDQDLTSAFGSPQVGDTSYGNYAPLPTIGRTGRVTCGFGISVDQAGNAGTPVVTVSVITYDMASRAVSRAAAEVSSMTAKGAAAQPILVDGHPATVLTDQAAAPASPATGPSATPGAGGSSGSGDSELVMADGNRTFVITIPLSKLSGSSVVNVLTNLAALVYQHTLPAGASASTSAAATPKPSAS